MIPLLSLLPFFPFLGARLSQSQILSQVWRWKMPVPKKNAVFFVIAACGGEKVPPPQGDGRLQCISGGGLQALTSGQGK